MTPVDNLSKAFFFFFQQIIVCLNIFCLDTEAGMKTTMPHHPTDYINVKNNINVTNVTDDK